MPPTVWQSSGHVDNPWLEQWLAALRASGAVVAPLRPDGLRAALGGRVRRGDWLQLQWPENVLSPPGAGRAAVWALKLLAMTALLRARGARVLLTLHNTRSHEQRHPRLERAFWDLLDRLVTDVHLMSEAARAEVDRAHPRLRRTPVHVVPHGHYRDVLPPLPDAAAARRACGLPAAPRVVLLFGAVRPYKGFLEYLAALDGLPAGWHVVVAGRCADPALQQALEARADERVTLRLHRHEDDELAVLLAACDVVALPYRAILNSGSALLALSCGRAVQAPDTPTFRELQDQVGRDWVHLTPGPPRPADLAALPRPAAGAPDLSAHAWPRIAALQADLLASAPR